MVAKTVSYKPETWDHYREFLTSESFPDETESFEKKLRNGIKSWETAVQSTVQRVEAQRDGLADVGGPKVRPRRDRVQVKIVDHSKYDEFKSALNGWFDERAKRAAAAAAALAEAEAQRKLAEETREAEKNEAARAKIDRCRKLLQDFTFSIVTSSKTDISIDRFGSSPLGSEASSVRPSLIDAAAAFLNSRRKSGESGETDGKSKLSVPRNGEPSRSVEESNLPATEARELHLLEVALVGNSGSSVGIPGVKASKDMRGSAFGN